jgi:ferredoxin
MRVWPLLVCAPLPAAAWISQARPRVRSALFNDWSTDSESWSDDSSSPWATDSNGASEDSSADSWSAWNDGDAGSAPNDDGSVRSASPLDDEAVDDAFISAQIATTLDDEAADAFISAAQGETAEALMKEERRDAQRARMIAAGATPDQIAAFLGGEATPSETSEDAVDTVIQQLNEGLDKLEDDEYVDPDLLGKVNSHELVALDEEGDPRDHARFVFVDEPACIGCYGCANIAPSTFLMEDEYGRARVFHQYGDDESIVREAMGICPMDCIHYVPFEELIALEKAREGQIINFKARLVGNDGLLSSNGANIQKGKDTTPRISSDGKIRCNNCPTRGCYDCPMFGVGRDPEFRRRQRKVSARRKEQQRKYAAEENNQREIDL